MKQYEYEIVMKPEHWGGSYGLMNDIDELVKNLDKAGKQGYRIVQQTEKCLILQKTVE